MNNTLHINWTRCDGRGLCAELLPAVLERDDWGYPAIRHPGNGDGTNADIGPDDAQAARDAVRLCPKLALSLQA